jgi:VWFA-related protein
MSDRRVGHLRLGPGAWSVARLLPCVLAVWAALVHAQQAPVFRSGVELITVEVSVVDRSGNPLRSLRSDQFEVTVDGRPRRVVSAELVDHAPVGVVAWGTSPVQTIRPSYSMNDDASTPVSPGRLIFLAVDQASFRAAGAKAAMEAAKRFIDRLQPSDRVGLVAYPPPGPSVGASKNHVAAREALGKIIGTAEPLKSTGSYNVSLAEAIDIRAGDMMALQMVVDRECRGLRGPELQMCSDSVRTEAQSIGLTAETQSSRSLLGLRALVEGLGRIPERKTVVVISAGLPLSLRVGGGLNPQVEINAIARLAANANANIYVLHIDSGFLDAFSASERRITESPMRDSSMLAAGLESVAAASGGTLVRVIAAADGAFDRVLRETAASYLLGIEPEESDRNGKAHTIRVEAKVPNAQVRSRREFTLPARGAADVPADPLAAALHAVRPVTNLPIGVATHVVGPEPGGGIRVLVSADIGRGLTGPVDIRSGLLITDSTGRVLVEAPETKQQLNVPAGRGEASAAYMSAVTLPAGDYILRLAASDASGHAGSVDHPFAVSVTSIENLTVGELLLLHPTSQDEGLSPVSAGRVLGTTVDGHIEFTWKGGTPPAVTFGVADKGKPDGDLLIQSKGVLTSKPAPARTAADARLDISLLPPGDYVAVAVVSEGKRRLAVRHEPLRVERAAATRNPAAMPRVRFSLGDSSQLVKPFSTTDVLAPEVLAYFGRRLRTADPAPPVAARTALAAFEAGQLEAILPALGGSTGNLTVMFLKGIGRLAKGEFQPAAEDFREALRVADDFLPAAFYLGACYAAGRRDDEAAGAWQTALVTENDARIVYDVLVDAQLRQENAEGALEILQEARDRWPADASFLPRLAVAQAMSGKREAALATLRPYLEEHHVDAETLALAVRLIYEAHAAGQTVVSDDADRELAAKYADWHRAAGGATQALVDRWVAFIAKK